MTFPDDLYYTEDHEWLRMNDDGTATIGITDFAQSELGDIVFVEVEPDGTELDEGDVFGTVEAVKTVSELYMPVAGTLVEFNEELDVAPESVNEEPYGNGWLVKIELADASDVDDLMDSEAYEATV
ncbi:glycine cleavage system protein H [Longibacter salinarum]|uniref:Glycine cleavage system H protein n=1 Tax=Longibacter salinarum TaxID=1850348 RepID=A0A2A8CYB8_9BACT|nr:glycine cleavage system protein GcvH [Longibacter salinarum]PEN13729.1 glycine cleavage system protein H [Longibacter salinarum]